MVLPDEYLLSENRSLALSEMATVQGSWSILNGHPVCPATYKLKTACMEVNKAGTLKVSKKIWAAISRFFMGFRGASVNKTGCYEIRQQQQQGKEQNSLCEQQVVLS